VVADNIVVKKVSHDVSGNKLRAGSLTIEGELFGGRAKPAASSFRCCDQVQGLFLAELTAIYQIGV
jgi:hypothetical protein